MTYLTEWIALTNAHAGCPAADLQGQEYEREGVLRALKICQATKSASRIPTQEAAPVRKSMLPSAIHLLDPVIRFSGRTPEKPAALFQSCLLSHCPGVTLHCAQLSLRS